LGQEKGDTPEEKDEGIKGVYPWGREWPPPKGAGNYDERLRKDNFGYTSPVGSFGAGKLGLYDLGGNVSEWCEDYWNHTSARQVLRDACWFTTRPDSLLSSYRDYRTSGPRRSFDGFRCVLTNGK